MGIVGLWKLLHSRRDAKIAPDNIYVDGWYLVIRVATAMQTVPGIHRNEVTMKTILSRRKGIVSLGGKGIIIVYDGIGVGSTKLPRASPAADDDIIAFVVDCIKNIFSDIATIIKLPPMVEADDYIISNVTPADAIISDDSDMLTSGVPVIRFNGDVYMPDDILDSLSTAVGRVVTLHDFRRAALLASSDKRKGPNLISVLRE